MGERHLDCALRQARCLRNRSETRYDWFPLAAHCLAVKVQINHISSRFLVVCDQIAHQDVEDVIIDGNGLFEARHAKK